MKYLTKGLATLFQSSSRFFNLCMQFLCTTEVSLGMSCLCLAATAVVKLDEKKMQPFFFTSWKKDLQKIFFL